MATPARAPMTAEELWLLPDDGTNYELIAGELRTVPPVGRSEGRLSARFSSLLDAYVTAHDLGEVYGAGSGFIVARDPDTVIAPDAGFVRRERLAELDEDSYIAGPPDLAVEVISPNDRYTEVEEKVQIWLEAGTRMVIVVNPRRRTVAVHRPDAPTRFLREGDTIDGEDVVPGWSMPMAALFAGRAG